MERQRSPLSATHRDPAGIAPFLLTAPGRERILAETLASWNAAQSGRGIPPFGPWSGAAVPPAGGLSQAAECRCHFAPLVIHLDPFREDPASCRPRAPMIRILAAYHSLLIRALAASTAPLLLEDDLAFAPTHRHGQRVERVHSSSCGFWRLEIGADNLDETPAGEKETDIPAPAHFGR